MSRKTRKRGRRRLLVIVVLLALIVFGVFARGLLTSGKTTTERAQRELDTYAENNDVSLADYPDAPCSSTPATRTRAILCATTRRRRT